MKMVSTKVKASKKDIGNGIDKSDGYPWGLEMTLESGLIKNLGMSEEDLMVGSEIDFHIVAEVVSVRKDPGQKSIDSCGLQITSIGEMEEMKDKPKKKTKTGLYSDMKSAMGGRIRE